MGDNVVVEAEATDYLNVHVVTWRNSRKTFLPPPLPLQGSFVPSFSIYILCSEDGLVVVLI